MIMIYEGHICGSPKEAFSQETT